MFRSLISVAAAFIATSSVAHAAAISETNYAGWLIGAYSDDATGAFSHCATAATYKSGTTLAFGLGRQGWTIALVNPNWRMPVGSQYQVNIQIDRNQPLPLTATATSSTMATASLEVSGYLFQLFKRGRLLTVYAPGERMQFYLTNSSKVLELTLSCANSYMNAAKNSNPFGAPVENSKPTSATAAIDHTAETTAFLANVLSSAGIQGFTLAPTTDPRLKPWEVSWTAPNLVGLALIDDKSGISESATVLTAADSNQCKGSFATTKQPSDDGRVLLLKTACQTADPKTSWRYSYTIASRGAGGSFIAAVIEFGENSSRQSMMSDVGSQLLNASVKYIEPTKPH